MDEWMIERNEWMNERTNQGTNACMIARMSDTNNLTMNAWTNERMWRSLFTPPWLVTWTHRLLVGLIWGPLDRWLWHGTTCRHWYSFVGCGEIGIHDVHTDVKTTWMNAVIVRIVEWAEEQGWSCLLEHLHSVISCWGTAHCYNRILPCRLPPPLPSVCCCVLLLLSF